MSRKSVQRFCDKDMRKTKGQSIYDEPVFAGNALGGGWGTRFMNQDRDWQKQGQRGLFPFILF